MFEEVRKIYARLEPEGVDQWNPLNDEIQSWHRLRMFHEARLVLQRLGAPPDQCTVLDVGCGVGRSTRMFLEFGCRPEHVTGVDIRPEAIRYAQRVNPAIQFRSIESLSQLSELGRFHLVVCCTVFSSLKDKAERHALALAMGERVMPGGGIFWWDLRRANGFAGGDALRPEEYFEGWRAEYRSECPLNFRPSDGLRPLRGFKRFIGPVLDRLGYRPTHIAAFLQRK